MSNFDGVPERPTIIIPVYNRATLVLRCLDSIAAQTWRPLRVIVVDNGSTDGTQAGVLGWIKEHFREDFDVRLEAEARPGAAAARQRGFEVAASFPESTEKDVVMFFDSDDTMEPTMVEEVMTAFGTAPAVDLVGWRERRHSLDGKTTFSRPTPMPLDMETQLVHSALSTERYAVRAGILRRAGGWNPDIRVWDDWELGVRILLCNPRIKTLDRALANVHSQIESITGTDFASRAGKWEHVISTVEETLARSDRPDKARLRRVCSYCRVILAAQYAREGKRQLAGRLLGETLRRPGLGPVHRLALRSAYRYTATGGRGAFTLMGWML